MTYPKNAISSDEALEHVRFIRKELGRTWLNQRQREVTEDIHARLHRIEQALSRPAAPLPEVGQFRALGSLIQAKDGGTFENDPPDAILDAAIRFIKALNPQPALKQEWRDISTAPKDGTEILAWHSGLALGAMVLSFWDGGWREKANCLRLKSGPHFWMPLPTPPADTQGRG